MAGARGESSLTSGGKRCAVRRTKESVSRGAPDACLGGVRGAHRAACEAAGQRRPHVRSSRALCQPCAAAGGARRAAAALCWPGGIAARASRVAGAACSVSASRLWVQRFCRAAGVVCRDGGGEQARQRRRVAAHAGAERAGRGACLPRRWARNRRRVSQRLAPVCAARLTPLPTRRRAVAAAGAAAPRQRPSPGASLPF